jgi:hypothetical protein
VKAPTLQALIDRAKGSGHVGAYVEFFTVIIRNKNICERRLSCDGARIGASFGLVDEPGAKHRIGKALMHAADQRASASTNCCSRSAGLGAIDNHGSISCSALRLIGR